MLCDVNKITKTQSSRLIYNNITKQEWRYSLFINIKSEDKNIGSRYINVKQKLRYLLSIKLKGKQESM